MIDETPFYMKKRFIASTIFLAVVAVTGIVFAVTGGDGSARGETGHAGQARHGSPSDSVCGLPPGNQDPVVAPPANTTWTSPGLIAAPSIPGVGPGVIDGHDRRCFQHGPLGATLAAANYVAIAVLPNGALTAAQSLAHIVPSHTRDVYARQPTPNITPNQAFQVVGFQDDVLGPDAVNVTLAVQMNGSGVIASVEIPLVWMAGDWKVRLLSIETPYVVQRLDTLEGFISWAAAPHD
jgi:hypothetical protein